MEILKVLERYKKSDQLAMLSGDSRITYDQLWGQSDKLAAYIKSKCKVDTTPIGVDRHKNKFMLVSF